MIKFKKDCEEDYDVSSVYHKTKINWFKHDTNDFIHFLPGMAFKKVLWFNQDEADSLKNFLDKHFPEMITTVQGKEEWLKNRRRNKQKLNGDEDECYCSLYEHPKYSLSFRASGLFYYKTLDSILDLPLDFYGNPESFGTGTYIPPIL